MTYVPRGPWVDGDQFGPDDAGAFDDAIALFNGGPVVDLGAVSGAATLDFDLGGTFQASLTGDAAFTVTNAVTAGMHRSADLVLATGGYTPTFPGCQLPAAGLPGSYDGLADQFTIETAAGQTTPLVRHIAGYGRYRYAMLGLSANSIWGTFDAGDWESASTALGGPYIGGVQAVFSPAARVFVWLHQVTNTAPYDYVVNTSRNGRDWTRQAFTVSDSNPRLLYNDHTGKVNIYMSSGATMYESVEGQFWTTKTLTGLDGPIQQLAHSPTLGRYFGAKSGLTGSYISSDGLAWSQPTPGTPVQMDRAIWAAEWGVFLGTYGDTIYSSADGITWTYLYGLLNYTFGEVVFNGSRAMVIARNNLTTNQTVFSSVNKTTWGAQAFPSLVSDDRGQVLWSPSLKIWLIYYVDSELYQVSTTGAFTGDLIPLESLTVISPELLVVGD